jgi:2OG-Fe(II) oxygenase superfamily
LVNISPIPPWLTCIIDRLESQGVTAKRCNHFLINEYKGAVGIMPHTDGPLYHPFVTILSLGSPVLFKFFSGWECFDSEDADDILLVENGSLFVFTGEHYTHKLHTIQDIAFESFVVPVHILTTLEGYSAKLGVTKIGNFYHTALFKNFFHPLFSEPGPLTGLQSKKDLIDRLKNQVDSKTFDRFTIDLHQNEGEEDLLKIAVSWARDLRVSMTARYVYPSSDG